MLQVYLVDVFNSIFNVIYFSVFNRASCGDHNVLGYGAQEANTIDVYEVTAYSEYLIFIKDSLGGIWYYDEFHMLDLVEDYFALKM